MSLLHQIALTAVPNIACIRAKILIDHYGNAEDIFKASKKELTAIEGIGSLAAESIKSFNEFESAEQEISFIEKYNIQPLFITDNNYPKRLLNCVDAPTMLYYKGNTDLNASRTINIVGSRNHTDYAKQVIDKLIQDLQQQQILVVSGLAFGVDALAHKAALQNELPTVGVLAHGLQMIYPPQHTSMAKDMLQNGGLLTEFPSNTIPDRHNFPRRNRIVAGMADATIVIETAVKGGSMITAELANMYNKDVFAIPGKITDSKSSGCNLLIRQNKAAILTDAQQLLDMMGWQPKKKKTPAQKQLFIELSPDEKIIVDILQQKEVTPIDELHIKAGLQGSAIAASLLNLELQGTVISMPGKMYKLS